MNTDKHRFNMFSRQGVKTPSTNRCFGGKMHRLAPKLNGECPLEEKIRKLIFFPKRASTFTPIFPDRGPAMRELRSECSILISLIALSLRLGEKISV